MDEISAYQMRRATWSFQREVSRTFLERNGTLGVNPAGAQCVNVPNSFWETFQLEAVPGDAWQFEGYEDAARHYVPHINIGPYLVGDVLVFARSSLYPLGHVAVVLDGSRGRLLTLSQNVPPGEPVHEVRFPRKLPVGLIRLRARGSLYQVQLPTLVGTGESFT